jgi:hypothetical protein
VLLLLLIKLRRLRSPAPPDAVVYRLLFLPASVLAVTFIVLSLWLHFLYFMLLLGYSVHQLRLPVAVLSLLLFVAEFPPILLVFWAVLFSRMDAGMALVCSILLVHFFLSLQRSMLHLLVPALLIILFALVKIQS